MEINPQNLIAPDAPLSNHTIRVDMQWSPVSLPGWIMFYDLQCDTNDYSSAHSTTGTNSYSLTSLGYENYQIQLRFGSLDPNQPTITGAYQLYYDEQLIQTANFQAQPASYSNFAYFNIHYLSPVLTDYTFSIYTTELCPGSYEDINITTSSNCNAVAEINTEQDSITLTIEDGREFVSLFKNNQKADTLKFMYNELGSVKLRLDSINTGTSPINVSIKSDWAGMIKNQQLVINPQEQYQIRVPDQPIIVSSGSAVGVKIEPYNRGICLPYISENIRYTALIKKGSSRGLLYDYDTGQSGDTLTSLTPQEDGEKYLNFVTEGEILSEQDTVIIKIFANDVNIDTTEAVIIIYPNDLVVQIIPPVISQGDTARVVLKKRGVNGLEEFAPDKLFNVEIVQGLEYGLILDSLSNDTLTSFSEIPQGFKIIAKDSTAMDSTKIRIKVTTEEIGFPVARIIQNNTKQNKKERIDDNNKQEREEEIIAPDWIIPGPILLEGFGDVVVKQDECDEEIVVCNNYQPPKFEDVGTITVLGENDPWQWIDDQGNPQTTNTGTACDYDIDPNEYGKTYIMQSIGDLASAPIYKRLDDIKITVCLDESNPDHHYWRFNVTNLRVPIFSDHCPVRPKANGFVDLGSGNNESLLADNIKNCTDYHNVIETLNWWKVGPYRQCGKSPPHKFYFSSGVIEHENVHVKQLSNGGTKAFPISSISKELNGQNGLQLLSSAFYLEKTSAGAYKCPEDALNAELGFGNNKIKYSEQIRKKLNEALDYANNLQRRGGFAVKYGCLKPNSEFEADELARPKYDEIRTNIENWAKQQSWWCIPWPIVGDDYYRGCDRSDCTH